MTHAQIHNNGCCAHDHAQPSCLHGETVGKKIKKKKHRKPNIVNGTTDRPKDRNSISELSSLGKLLLGKIDFVYYSVYTLFVILII